MTQAKPSIFISYGREDDHQDHNDPDKSFLRKLYTDLTSDEYEVWWDRVSMPSRGLNFMQEIQDAITQHDKLILIVGPHAITQSDYVRYEWQYALRICLPIIPILLKRDPKFTDDNDQFKQVPLDGLHTINALDWGADGKYERVLKELKRILGEDAPLGETHNLPLPPRGYIERDGFAQLQQDLLVKTSNPVVIAPHEQVVAVQGAGGIGKSTLASALAWSCAVRRHYVDGVYWIRLGKVKETDIVQRQATLGRQLGDDGANYVDQQSGRTRLSHLLADKKVLLVLDDVWHTQQTQAFDAISADSRILITTRQRDIALKTGGEPHELKQLTEEEGLLLIGSWLGREADADNEHEDEERQIVTLLGGYTLAIAIAAAKLADPKTGYDHANLLKRLQAGRIFQDIQLDPQDKNVNLEKSLLLSYEDLSNADRQRFRQLGVLAPNADFDQTLIQALWEDDEFEAEDALNRLVSVALLDKDESGRWKQHTVLGAYARALLTPDEQDEAFVRYVEYVTEVANQTKQLPMQDWDSQIGPDYAHIDHVGDTLTANPDSHPTLTADFIWAVQLYVVQRPVLRDTPQGRHYRGLDWLKVGAKLYGDLNQKNRQATTLNNIGAVYRSLGQMDKALDYYQRALPIFSEVGDRSGEATTLTGIGTVYSDLGDKQQALDYYQQVLPMHREVGNRTMEAATLSSIGLVYSDLGDQQQALDYYQGALPIRREVGDRSGEAATLNNIGGVYSDLGDQQQALDYFQRVLPIRREVGDRRGEATTLNNIGLVYSDLGDQQQALDYYQRALPIFSEVGDRSGEATTLSNIGGIYFARGDLQKAAETAEQIIPIVQEIGDVASEALYRFNLGHAYHQMGRIDDAISQVERAIALLRSKGLTRSAGGLTIEEMQAFLARLKGETPPPQEDSDTEKIMAQLAGLYLTQGEDAVREMLKKTGMPDEVIEQGIAEIKRRVQAEMQQAMQALKQMLADKGEDAVREWLKGQGADDEAIDAMIRMLRDG